MNAGKKKYRLPRKNPTHRRALIKSQLLELLRNGKIKTTPAKARVLTAETEVVINLAKQNTVGSLNKVKLLLPTERSVERLMQLLPAWEKRNSGYTTVIRTLPRAGDNAAQVFVMLLDIDQTKEKKSVIQQTLEKQKKTSKSKKPTKK